MHFTWTDTTNATEYVVVQDHSANGTFELTVGTASSGNPGLTVPMPPGDLKFFLVAGKNSVVWAQRNSELGRGSHPNGRADEALPVLLGQGRRAPGRDRRAHDA